MFFRVVIFDIMGKLRTSILLFIGIFLYSSAIAQKPFIFQNKSIEPGTKKYFKIPVLNKKDSTFIPVTVFHGSKSGPVLGITAGIHGYEYPPILAAQQLNQKIDPQQLSGTIIMVQVANMPGFLGRTPNLNPLDDKNLNRTFPGNATGSITERMAHTITNEIISKSDYFVDMHAGDAPEDLHSYNAWYHCDALPKVSQEGKEMALSMGFDYMIRFNVSKERLQKPSLYCSQEAFHRKIPAVDIECGRLGIPGKEETDQILKSMFSLFKYLQIMSSKYTSSTNKTSIIEERFTIKSNSTGIFYSYRKAGDIIKKGESVGYITDLFGKTLEEIKAPKDGIILYMIGTPPINKDETIMSAGILSKEL